MNHKGRRIHSVLGTFLAAALPGLALASPPSDVALGQVDAILSYCAKVAPRLGKDAEEYRESFSREAPKGVRKSADYQQGYKQVSEALAKGNQAQQIAACTAGLTKSEHRRHDDDRSRDRDER